MTIILTQFFYLEMLQWWSEFRLNFSTDSKAFDSLIWNNCNLKIDGKPICYHNYINSGIIFISDLMFSWNSVKSFNIAKDKGLLDVVYCSLLCAKVFKNSHRR